MLSFISSLFVSSEDAHKAFFRGEPKADSPVQANVCWAPYVRHWKKMLKRNAFDKVIARGRKNGRLGWLEDASYWKAYWSSFDALCKRPYFFANDGLRMSMVSSCVQEAAAQGNMALFRHAASVHAKQTVSDCLQISHRVLPPCVLEWLSTVEDRTDFKAQDVLDDQARYWRTLPWSKIKGGEPLFSQLHQPQDIERFDDRLVAGFRDHGLDRQQQVCAIGHILVNCPAAWMRPELPGDTVVERLKMLVQPYLVEGVDIDAIALCCGHGSNANATLQDIKKLGKFLVMGSPTAERFRGKGPDLAMLRSLYDLNTPWSLYDAVQTSGLAGSTPKSPAEAFSLPDMGMA